MLKHRRPHPWLAFLIAMVLPLASLGCVFVGGFAITAGNVVPTSAPFSSQPQEEETHSHSKGGVNHAVRQNKPRSLTRSLVSALPVVEQEHNVAPLRKRFQAEPVLVPSINQLNNDLARRGPPVA